jgi:hypothetical protein
MLKSDMMMKKVRGKKERRLYAKKTGARRHVLFGYWPVDRRSQ